MKYENYCKKKYSILEVNEDYFYRVINISIIKYELSRFMFFVFYR